MPSACSRVRSGRIVTLLRLQGAQVVERLGHAHVLGAECRPSADERLFEQTLRLLVHAKPPIEPPHESEDLRLRLGLADEISLHLVGAGIEQAPDRRSIPRGAAGNRIGAREQPGQYFAHLGGFRGLPLGAVALCREPDRIERRRSAQQQDDRCGRGDTAHMSADERGGPIAQRVRACADWLVTQKPPNIVCQGGDGGITLRGVLLQRLGDDGVEIPAKGPPQPGRRGTALGGMTSERFLCLCPADNRIGYPPGVLVDNGTDEWGGRLERPRRQDAGR